MARYGQMPNPGVKGQAAALELSDQFVATRTAGGFAGARGNVQAGCGIKAVSAEQAAERLVLGIAQFVQRSLPKNIEQVGIVEQAPEGGVEGRRKLAQRSDGRTGV